MAAIPAATPDPSLPDMAAIAAQAAQLSQAAPPPTAPSSAPAVPDVGVYDIPGAPTPGPLGPGTQGGPSDAQRELEAVQRAALLKGVDQSSNASWKLREAVNLAPNDASRLATIRAYAPDAQPLPGTDNFVYTDPQTGVRSIYRSGFGPKDLTTVAAGVPSLLGSVVGGVMGGATGNPLLSLLGIGAGGTAGSETGTRIGEDLLGTKDVRTPGQIAAQDVTQTAVNSALAWLVPSVVSSYFGRTAGNATVQAMDDLHQSGVAPNLKDVAPPSVVAQSPGLSVVESSLAQTPGGRGTVINSYKQTSDRLGQGVANVAADTAGTRGVPQPPDLGASVNSVARNMGDAWTTYRNGLDDAVKTAVNRGSPANVDISPLQVLRDRLVSEQVGAKGGTDYDAAVYQPAIDRLNGIITGGGNEMTTPFATLQKNRSLVGDIAYGDDARAGQVNPAAKQNMTRVYDALGEVIQNKVNAAGPDAQGAYSDYMNAVRSYRGDPATGSDKTSVGAAVENLQDPKYGGDALVRMMLSDRPVDRATFSNFMKFAAATDATDPGQQGEIAAGLVNKLAIKPDGTFDPLGFARTWAAIPADTKAALLPGADGAARIASLNNLATVASQLRESLLTKAFSNTPAAQGVGKVLGSAGLAAMSGHPWVGAGILGTGLVGPWGAAKLMFSKPFTDWLTGSLGDTSAGAAARAIASLPAVATADPSIRGYVNYLQSQLSQQQQPPGPMQISAAGAPQFTAPAQPPTQPLYGPR